MVWKWTPFEASILRQELDLEEQIVGLVQSLESVAKDKLEIDNANESVDSRLAAVLAEHEAQCKDLQDIVSKDKGTHIVVQI